MVGVIPVDSAGSRNRTGYEGGVVGHNCGGNVGFVVRVECEEKRAIVTVSHHYLLGLVERGVRVEGARFDGCDAGIC